MEKASIYNFEDDNTLLHFSKAIAGLLHILQWEPLKIIKRLEKELNIKAVPTAELVAIKTDAKLRFNTGVSKICNSEANQFNARTC